MIQDTNLISNNQPSDDILEKVRQQQDPLYAIVGGLSAALVGGLLWAIITVATKYQIGYMAIAIGLLVGMSVRYFGAGVDQIYGVIGAFFALLSCAIGNLLSQVGFIADAESMSYFEVLTVLTPSLILQIFQESASPMDIVFYGIAGYEGYKFAFRNVADVEVNNETGQLGDVPYAKMRLPAAIALVVILFVGFYFLRQGSVGLKTYYYDTGEKLSEGLLDYGKMQGPWQFFWTNGKVKQTGYYIDGREDSIWQFYNEEGTLVKTGQFRKGNMHGVWLGRYSNGNLIDSGNYVMGRQQGLWTTFYEDGTISRKGFYNLDRTDSTWEIFHPNGNPQAKGSFAKSDLRGAWTYWYEDGKKNLELEYVTPTYSRIWNAWDQKGKQFVKNGNGQYTDYYFNGNASESGRVENGERVGTWTKFNDHGTKLEEGHYNHGIYYMDAYWSRKGDLLITKGKGTYESYYDSLGTINEKGNIVGGLRQGDWEQRYISGKSLAKLAYDHGKLQGHVETFFESGDLTTEGSYANDLREGDWTWYYEGGIVECKGSYKKGMKIAEQAFYSENGNLLRTELYNNDKLLSVSTAPEEGDL